MIGDRRLYRDWMIVDVVYIPAKVCGAHWVACAVDFDRRHITVYDSSPSVHDEDVMSEAMRPLCTLLPHLMRYGGVYAVRTDLDDSISPFTYTRPLEGVPHQDPESNDSGIFTIKFIEYLGLGRSFDFGPEHGAYFRRKIALDLYVGRLL